MNRMYHSQEEYLEEILELCAMYVSMLSEKPKCSRKEIRWKEQEIIKRCEDTMNGESAIGLEYLFRVFQLSDFQCHCVRMALAAELSSEFSDAFAENQKGLELPTVALCLQTFTDSVTEQIRLLDQWYQNGHTLSYFFECGISETDRGSQISSGLKLYRRIIEFALDFTTNDTEIFSYGGIFWPDQAKELVIRREILEKMRQYDQKNPQKLLFYLYGDKGSGRQTLVQKFCGEIQRPLVWINLFALMTQKSSWETMLRPFFRETVIRNAILAVRGLERLQEEEKNSGSLISWLLEEGARWTNRIFFLSDRPWNPEINCRGWQRTDLHLEMPGVRERRMLWEHVLKEKVTERKEAARFLADKFALLPGQIDAGAEKAEQLRDWEGAEQISDEMLFKACRSQLSSHIEKLATRVNADYCWEDLILPDSQKQKLMEACQQVMYHHKVYEEWGFDKKVAYGRGISMLFSGPPGTGKTMAAQVIAKFLQLELYKVDLSGIISKYIGETEKHLNEIFTQIRKSQGILFFDEADAMFGKRSEIKDSHDRYANVQTSYLLQKIEEYDGIVILASNLIQNFDEAFKRRIKFIVEFTLPDQEQREQIWKSVIPPALPLAEEVDFEFLARSYQLSGSSIKNIVVASSFLAAADGVPVNMAHLLVSVQAEQRKAGKFVSREELGEYYTQVEEYERRKDPEFIW